MEYTRAVSLRLFDGRGEMFSSSRHNDRLSFSMHTHTQRLYIYFFIFSFEEKEGGDLRKEMYSIEKKEEEREISYTIVRPVAFGLAHFSGRPSSAAAAALFSCVSIPAVMARRIYIIPRSFIRHPFFFSISFSPRRKMGRSLNKKGSNQIILKRNFGRMN